MQSVGVTLLAAPADGIPPSFLLSLKPEQSYLRPVEYLFNVPCAYSRLVLEHRARPGLGLRAIFASGIGCHALVRHCVHAFAMHGARLYVHARPFLLQGGLGGLLLRLRQDGHGHVKLLGPSGKHWAHSSVPTTFNGFTSPSPQLSRCYSICFRITHAGTKAVVEGLTEFVHWSSPEVQVVELQQGGASAGGSAEEGCDTYEDDQIQVGQGSLLIVWGGVNFYSASTLLPLSWY